MVIMRKEGEVGREQRTRSNAGRRLVEEPEAGGSRRRREEVRGITRCWL